MGVVEITSSYHGTDLSITSWIIWLGVDIAKCKAAAPAIGPFGLWGAIAILATLAAEAIFFASRRPPQWFRSGWAISIALKWKSDSNSSRPINLSPVAKGQQIASLIWSNVELSPGCIGSSIKIGL